eukprot:TRINITY_DN19073_c0_g2_i2.p1 TRINITY_DN19073_c0_g2~~TRINITY_DN19073_c0_g2_i2.p1  ORF type:complete len:261 (+),score=50.79 TRINITY_DN19073_c0_g2_i2:68-850(+)
MFRTLLNLSTGQKFALAVGGSVTFFGSMLLSQAWVNSRLASDPLRRAALDSKPLSESDRIRIFDSLAPRYDSEVRTHEFFTGILMYRYHLLKQAQGDVLEVGVGTGRNFAYFPSNTRVTAVDASAAMATAAQASLAALKPNQRPASVQIMVANGQQLPFPDASFDTVVDTFGLCSFENPVAVLHEMKRVLKPNGKILLLEHGKSHYDFLNTYLHNLQHRHLHKFGCYWNRDIMSLVSEAGLTVHHAKRHQLGTVYSIQVS